MIHGPSLAIGAVISSVVIIIAFFAFNGISNEVELVMEPTPIIQELGPTIISMETYLANGSPILGDPNAPITLVEFGDYQCSSCYSWFHKEKPAIYENYIATGKANLVFWMCYMVVHLEIVLVDYQGQQW